MSGYSSARLRSVGDLMGGQFRGRAFSTGGRSSTKIVGVRAGGEVTGSYSGTITPALYGAQIYAQNDATGAASVVTAQYGIEVSATVGGATTTTTTLYGAKIGVTKTAGTVTTAIGLRIDDVSAGTTSWAIQSAGGQSYHVGALTLGAAQAPDSKAILDLVSTTQAFLPPRMTTTQRDAISSPTEGSVIYNTTTKVLNFYNGSAWGAV